ncbi:pilin [Marinicella sp. W31]|uniref:pilin n=1 Tax=Marinicella sp. W31 TaxID=3023713 RepID=UPI0037573983
MIKKIYLTLVTTCVVFLAACDGAKTNENKAPEVAKTTIKKEQVLTSQSWLNLKLPEQTLAYVRMPSIWNQWFEAKGDLLQSVQSSEAHKKHIQNIRKGLIKTYLPLVEKPFQGLIEALIINIKTPLEIAVVNAGKGGFLPTVLLGTRFQDKSIEQMQAFLGDVVTQSQGVIQIVSDLNEKGEMHLRMQQFDVLLQYAEDSGRLAVLGGMQVKRETLDRILQSQRPAQALNRVLQEGKAADPAGLSFQAWVAVSQLYALTKGMLPPAEQAEFEGNGLHQMEYFWMGSDNSDRRSEFVVKAMMPEVGFRQYIPRVESVDSLHTAGNPRRVFALALPTNEQIAQAFDYHGRDADDILQMAAYLDEKINTLNKYLDFNSELILTTYGQKLFWISDDAGDWLALRIKDINQHQVIAEKLGLVFNASGGKRTLSGVEINESHFSITQFYYDLLDIDLNNLPGAMGMMPDFKEHTYWLVDGDFLVLAAVPQILADRANHKKRQKLNVWLKSQQGMNWDNTVFGLTYDIARSPRDTYHYYLILLQLLADVSKTEVDLFTLPTASELALPKSGRFGLRMDSSEDSLSLHISYEYSMLEGFYTFGGVTTMYLAVVAAYAVPAYRDYTIRAKIGSQLAIAASLKVMLAEMYISQGRIPTEVEFLEGVDMPEHFTYSEEDGSLIIDVSAESNNSGAILIITPRFLESGVVMWSCQAQGLAKGAVPSSCR